mgnify:CR=1 FL=1
MLKRHKVAFFAELNLKFSSQFLRVKRFGMEESMRALIVKDIRLFRSMKNVVLIYVVMIAASIIFGQKQMGVMLINLCVVMFTYLSMSTMSYDDFDNGMEFILTLPILKKIYVIEKYVLAVITLVVMSIVGAGLLVALGLEFNAAILDIAPMAVIAIVLVSINLPLTLKFGSEKTKMLTMILFMGLGAAVGSLEPSVLNKLLNYSFVKKIMSLGKLQLGIGIGLIVVVIFIVSCCISIKISENKEY